MKEAFHYLNLNTKNSGEIDKDSRISLKRELVVNCAGSINTKRVHKTNNALGRKDYYLIYITEGVLCFDSLGISTKLKPFDVISAKSILTAPPSATGFSSHETLIFSAIACLEIIPL